MLPTDTALMTMPEGALCEGMDPALFDPDCATVQAMERTAAAVCAVCPVRVQCYALGECGQATGLLGGHIFADVVTRECAAEGCLEPVRGANHKRRNYCSEVCANASRRVSRRTWDQESRTRRQERKSA